MSKSLRENAWFLINVRERLRPSDLLGTFMLTAIVLLMILVGSLAADKTPDNSEWARSMATWLYLAQWVVVVPLGTFVLGRVLERERVSGTLDFHRISPTPKSEQMLGLLLGGPCREWLVFLATLPISLTLLLLAKAPLSLIVSSYISLFSTALLSHLGFLAIGLSFVANATRTDPRRNYQGIAFGFVMIFWWFPFVMAKNFPLTIHLLGFAPLAEIFGWFSKGEFLTKNGVLFGFNIASLPFQLLLQFPFILFAAMAVWRKLSHPEWPVFTKAQALGFATLILALFFGSIDPDAGKDHWSGFWLLLVALGALGLWIVTPTYARFTKGLYRESKTKRLAPWNDDAGNLAWQGAAYVVFGAACAAMRTKIGETLPLAVLTLLLLNAFAVLSWFGGALEYFRLSSYRSGKNLFALAIVTLWIFIPSLGGLVALGTTSNLTGYFSLLSPAILLFDHDADGALQRLAVAAALNCALAVWLNRRAWQEQRKLRASFSQSAA